MGYLTTTIIGTVAALASSAVGVASSVEQSNNQKAQLQHQADLAEYNAKLTEDKAQITEDEGRRAKREADEAATRKRQEAALMVGSQRSKQGASGAQVDIGSNLDLNLDTTERGELNALQQEEQGKWQDHNKKLEAWNLRSQGTLDQLSADAYNKKAQQYSPLLNSAPTLLNEGQRSINTLVDTSKSIDAYLNPKQNTNSQFINFTK